MSKEKIVKTDFEKLEDGRCITLHPNESNPLHSEPVRATYSQGYFFCHNSNPEDGPDYYLGDVLAYNEGYTD